MIDNKMIPNEFVSIRQVWLCQINRCLEAMTNSEIKDDHSHGWGGDASVIDGIRGLYYTLVDYGEAKVKTDVEKLHHKWLENKMKELRDKEKETGEKQTMKTSLTEKKRFQIIIQVLNKYGMLFESQPKGYSNVEMKSI